MLTGKTIVVSNLVIDVSIGVHAHERVTPQRLVVSVEAEMDALADEDDRLRGTLDYDLVCDFIRSLSHRPHVALQETIARLVIEFVMAQPGVAAARVETRKPDVFEDCDFVGVRLTAERGAA